MKVNLFGIRSKEKVCINLKILINNMKANFIMESSMDKENLNFTNMIFMRVSLKIMSFMVKEN